MSKAVENSIMNNPDDFFGGRDWCSYHKPESIGYRFEEKSGLNFAGCIGFGKGMSVEFGLAQGLTMKLDLRKRYGRIWINAYSLYAVNGLPLENWQNNMVETVKVEDNDKAVEKGILQIARAVKKAKAKTIKAFGKKAKESSEAKALWMMTI
jgi:hypothetical protein